MNQTVGIQVDIKETASVTAPKIVDQLNRIGEAGEQSAEKIQKAFEQLFISNQLDKFQQKLKDTFTSASQKQADEVDKANRRESTKAGGGSTAGGALSAGRFLSRVGSSAGELGSTGNAMGAGSDVLGGLSSMLTKAGPVGIGIAAVAAIAAGTGIIIDQLSKQYEPFVSTLMDTTAAFGELRDSAKENSMTFRTTLQDAAKSASKFGYSIEQGLEVYNSLSRGGMGSASAKARAEQELGYARGFGITNFGALSQAQIMAQRYGGGNVLGLTAGGLGASGMGAGRYEEYLQSMMGVFEEGISKGVVRGFDEISSTMNFFSTLGETWRGQLGGAKIGQLNAAVGQGTSLQKETDVLLYRAAKSMVGEKGDYIEVMKQMERGITSPGMFESISKQIGSVTGGHRTDTIEMMRGLFGMSYTDTESLYKAAFIDKDFGKAAAKVRTAPKATSTELDLVRAENDLRMSIITLGENTIEAKKDLVKAAGDLIKALEDITGADIKGQRKRTESEEYKRLHDTAYPEYLRSLQGISGSGFSSMLGQIGLTSTMRLVGGNSKYASYLGASDEIMSLLQGTSETTRGKLSGEKRGALYKLIQSIGNKDVSVEPEELAEFVPKLKGLIDQIQANAVKDNTDALRENTKALKEPYEIEYQEKGVVK